MQSTQEKTEVVRARVAPEVKRKVARIARNRRSRESDVVRSAISEFIERAEREAA